MMHNITTKLLLLFLAALSTMMISLAIFGFGKFVSDNSPIFWSMVSSIGTAGALLLAAWIYFKNAKEARSKYYVEEAINSLKEMEILSEEINQPDISNKIIARKLNCLGELCFLHIRILKGITEEPHRNIYLKHHTRTTYVAGSLLAHISVYALAGANEPDLIKLPSVSLPQYPTREFTYYSLIKNKPYGRRIVERTEGSKDLTVTPFNEGVCLLRALYIFRLLVLPPSFNAYPKHITPREVQELFYNHLATNFSDYIYSCCQFTMEAKDDGYYARPRTEPLEISELDLLTETVFWTEYFTYDKSDEAR